MKLKTYQARSMSEALIRVKKDLGQHAVILHTRTLTRGGVLGIGSRTIVEITATADKKVMAFRKADDAFDSCQLSVVSCQQKSQSENGGGRAGKAISHQPSLARPRPSARTGWKPVPQSPSEVTVDARVRHELSEIRAMVQDLLRHKDRSTLPGVPSDLIDFYTHLIGQEVAEELAVDLLKRASVRLQNSSATRDARGRFIKRAGGSCTPSPMDRLESGGENAQAHEADQSEKIRSVLMDTLVEMLPPAAPLKLKVAQGPTVVALVGPTGVGKTTTIAKLAANMKLREQKRVGLVTIDSYRIAAVQQLKTYANILKVPLLNVMTPADMTSAIGQMSDLDLILIDTAGRSQRDEPRIAELGEFLKAAEPDQIHLVLSTTSGDKVIRQAITAFSALGAHHLIFTKIDEAVGLGVILNVLKGVDLRLSYLTNGQSVPDDIELGNASRVARLILGDSICKPAVLNLDESKMISEGTQPS